MLSRRGTKIAIGVGVGLAAIALMASPAGAQELEGVDLIQFNLDNVFIMLCAALVLFMQAGFALVEAGLTRAKSVANIMMKNLMDLAVGVLAFAAVGFSFAYGDTVGSFIGAGDWFLSGDANANGPGLTLATDFFFQVAFAATAATIVSGAMAERTKFKSYMVYTFFITALIYPIVVHWTWGGGWLAELGYTDFAGSGIVHMTGGVAAMVGAAILGPRIGKYGADGKPRAIPGHSIPFAIIGCFILLIGWFGFNPGSQLAADAVIGQIALATLLAAAAGAVAATAMTWIKDGKPDVAMAGNGLLAGLVGITAGPHIIGNWGAVAVGAIAGVIVVLSVTFFDRVKIDDPVGAVSVHGTCGAWGVLAVGIFATDGGLLAGDGAGLLLDQATGVVAITAFVGISMGIIFMAIKATMGLRVSEQEEIEGLDVHEHGYPGYSNDISFAGTVSGTDLVN